MNLKEMTTEQLLERRAKIATEVETDGADLTALEEEVRAINEELETRKKAEEIRKQTANKISLGAGEVLESRTVETTEVEVRNTEAYERAFIKYAINGNAEECRALLTVNASGVVPIPTTLETEIKNAWEECQLLSLVHKTKYIGDVKVGFEISASEASIHVEGAEAPAEATIKWGVVDLKAQSIKEWVTISEEAVDNTSIDTLREIYKTLAQKIGEKTEAIIVQKITASPTESTETAPCIAKEDANEAKIDTIVKAVAKLSGKAKKLTLVMNRQTKADFTSLALNAKYAVDVFDGLKDNIVFTDALPALSQATNGQAWLIVGDFGYGFQVNEPTQDIKLITDRISLNEKGLVKVIGTAMKGLAVVAPKAFTVLKKAD